MSAASRFSHSRTILLETYRRSGEPVRTTVLVVEEGGTLYVRTDPRSGKAKRVRRDSRVRAAPSDIRGRVKGDWAEGRAAFVEGPEAARVLRLFRRRFGLMMSLLRAWLLLRRAPRVAVLAIRLSTTGEPAERPGKPAQSWGL